METYSWIYKDKSLSPALTSSIKILTIIQILVDRQEINSKNSSLPSSKDRLKIFIGKKEVKKLLFK